MKNRKGSLLKNVATSKFKSQDRFRFDGHQPTNVDFTSVSKYKIQELTPNKAEGYGDRVDRLRTVLL